MGKRVKFIVTYEHTGSGARWEQPVYLEPLQEGTVLQADLKRASNLADEMIKPVFNRLYINWLTCVRVQVDFTDEEETDGR